MEYEIIIKTREPYKTLDYQYEGSDGKNYNSQYGLPDGVKVKKVPYETGEISHTETIVLTQKIKELDLAGVIRAINKI